MIAFEEKDITSSSVPEGNYESWKEADMKQPPIPETWGGSSQYGRHLHITANEKSPQRINFNIDIQYEEKCQLFETINNHLRKIDLTN